MKYSFSRLLDYALPIMNPTLIIFVLISYLVGAIPVGLLVARARGVDIRKVGSGNIGATNVFRSIGKPWGTLTFVADALKGFLPAFFLPGWTPEAAWPVGVLYGCAAIIGHNWPIYLRFKGGKGVATSAGVLLGIAPGVMGVGVLVWILLMALTRYVSVASIGAAIAIPVAGWWLYGAEGRMLPVVLTLLGILVVYRHRSNIQRLLNGTENRFDFGKKLKRG